MYNNSLTKHKTKTMKILIADNLNIIQKGVNNVIKQLTETNKVDEVSDGNSALSKVCSDEYDLAILGDAIPGLSGLEVLQKMKEKKLKTRVLIFSEYPRGEISLRAFKMGASGYLSSYSAASVLDMAINQIASGEGYGLC
jgi:DNA-binding NarL/FixJ family response regulator